MNLSQGEQWQRELLWGIGGHLDSISLLFKEPKRVKITLVVRQPWLEDGDVVVGDDDSEAAIAAIRRLAGRETVPASVDSSTRKEGKK